ncbi:peptidoglycan endopeptidase [Novosphingobium sp. ZN18A2]|uniref:peptidoglycan endopeptidase n=1 Tax=Novosphingobium sp. ZN18A2 TaxID=3079861 RepID=UPI0030CB4A12
MNPALAEAALGLVGTPFRLHGRDPSIGLDCVGLVGEAMRRAGFDPSLPEGYRLRVQSVARWLRLAATSGLVPVARDGDVILLRTHPLQPHLAVIVPGGIVHAHAGLGRTTFLPGPIPWPVERRWRAAPAETIQTETRRQWLR